MNQRLRKRHRRLMLFVAIVTPVVFAAAIITRPSFVAMNSIAPIAGNIIDSDAVLLSEETLSLDGTPTAARLYRTMRQDGAALSVQLAPLGGRAVAAADVLVYWHEGGSLRDRVPDEALLLGVLAGPQVRSFELPGDVAAGEILFYSLAQQRLFADRWPLPQ